MYFQDILQGITSDLMDSNLFKLKSRTLWKTYRWMLVTHLEIVTNTFTMICGNFFLKIPVSQLNLGHWSFAFKLSIKQEAICQRQSICS